MRTLTDAFKTAIAGGTVRVGLICEVDYPTVMRCWTGIGDLSWGGQTWKGIGNLGNISAVQELLGPQAGSVKLSLAGVAPEMRALALANTSAGCLTKIWLACFTEAPITGIWSVIDAPWQCFSGTSDTHKISGGVIELTVETDLARLKQSKVSRYTNQEQQRHWPDDTGFRFGATIGDAQLYWGTAAPVGAATGGSAGSVDSGLQ